MHFHHAVFLAFSVVLAVARATAAVGIPFEKDAGLIWIDVAAEGHAAPLRFLLDSGAGQSVIDLRAARALGWKLGAPQTVRGVGGRGVAFQVSAAPMNLAGVPLPSPRLALDLRAVAAACGRRIDGLIGADFFRAHTVQIDWRAAQLRLLPPGESPAAGTVLPLIPRGDAFCVRLSVNDQPPAWVRVDTGCDSALEWLATRLGSQPMTGTTIAAGPGSRHRVPTTVQLGTLRLAEVSTGLRATPIFPGEAGLLGNGLLARFTVTFDTAKKRLLLSPQ